MARWPGCWLVVALGCAHARDAEDASSAQAEQPEAARGEAEPAAEGQAEPPQEAEATQAAPSQSAPERRGMVAGGSRDPDEVPVATSARGLLKPGAEQKVRDRIGAEGKSLRKALQDFQRSHDLPATGMLDHETVEQLGLNPDEIFERAGAE